MRRNIMKIAGGILVGACLMGSNLPGVCRAANIDPVEAMPMENGRAAANVFGTFSVENFQGTQNNLRYTHESAAGFRAYLQRFHAPNFVNQDAGVGAWAFRDIAGGDNLDLWTSNGTDYGVDSVLVSFHSSHGGMAADGTYGASLGSNWGNRGWSATSNNMVLGANAGRFGDERLRYMFWDTCFSNRITGGHNPLRTWGARARGLRMLFGYETVSFDNPNYGTYFWEEWAKGKSFTMAFLDASWRISQRQTPVAVAFGSTQAEAVSRRDNEKQFAWGAVRSNWAAWRFYSAMARVAPEALSERSIPERVAVLGTESKGNTDGDLQALASALRLDDAGEIRNLPLGMRSFESKGAKVVAEPNGNVEINFESRDLSAAAPGRLTDDEAVSRAVSLIDDLGLTEGHSYRVDSIRYLKENSAPKNGKVGRARTIEKTVVINQVIDGMEFVDPDAGSIQVSFNVESGRLVKVRNTFRTVTASALRSAVPEKARTLDELRRLAVGSTSEATRASLQIVADSEKIGYRMIEGKATPVYRALLSNPAFPDSKLEEAVVPLSAQAL